MGRFLDFGATYQLVTVCVLIAFHGADASLQQLESHGACKLRSPAMYLTSAEWKVKRVESVMKRNFCLHAASDAR